MSPAVGPGQPGRHRSATCAPHRCHAPSLRPRERPRRLGAVMPDNVQLQAMECITRSKEETGWYRDAVIYQTHVRAFFDSNGDGVGDFPGLTSRLDHIADLGATAIWLLPFYPSPLRDDGYDISDYTAVNPSYGTLDDFRAFVEAAHACGLRVIIE